MLILRDKIPFAADAWPAKWIWAPGRGAAFEVVQFSLRFAVKPGNGPLTFHVSADNRYKLYLDGMFLGLGPQRGDLAHWYFDSYQIPQNVDEGEHVLSAVVWHIRDDAPLAQISSRPAFLLAAEGIYRDTLSTDTKWQCRRWPGNAVLAVPEEAYAAGPGFEMTGWTDDDLCPSRKTLEREFHSAVLISLGKYARDSRAKYSDVAWRLTPRTIAALEARSERLGVCRRAEMLSCSDKTFSVSCTDIDALLANDRGAALTIPPHTHLKFLIDHSVLTMGYPIMHANKGRGAIVTFAYQEALQRCPADILSKGHRDEIEGRAILGIVDRFCPDGRQKVMLEPLWFRCWRYIEVEIQTGQEPLELPTWYYRTTGYPLELKAGIKADPSWERLLEPGFRTMRLCAGETYFDCPYYEQLQYVGDTRIQALLSYLISGEDRLAREAIDTFDRSREANGLTPCCFPNRTFGVIPVFSLIYVAMLYDFLMWRGDKDFVRRHSDAVEAILRGFEIFLNADGLVGIVPGWAYVDWVNAEGWDEGVPPGAHEGNSYLLNFHYLYALQQAALLFKHLGDAKRGEEYRRKADLLQRRLQKCAYHVSSQLFVDDVSGRYVSQHTNIMAILTDTHKGILHGEKLLLHILRREDVVKVSPYFSFYLFEAMYHVGRGDLIGTSLKLWHEMLANGLTTFTETAEPTRSDCHAWSAHPLYHYYASILGVRPTKPGCEEMVIAPACPVGAESNLTKMLGGSFMTPHGLASVNLLRQGKNWQLETCFPAAIKLQKELVPDSISRDNGFTRNLSKKKSLSIGQRI